MQPAIGLDDPTLSYNLSTLTYYGSSHPFIDLMKYSRAFVGSTMSDFNAMSNAGLANGGHLDENGWPTSIPDGMRSVGTLWKFGGSDAAVGIKGTYVARWDGQGEVKITGGGVNVLSQTSNEIVFEMKPSNVLLRIFETDPYGNGNYVRDVTVMKQEHVELHEAGQVFNPDFLSVVEDARELRFVHWSRANGSNATDWETRRVAEDVTYATGSGVPLEIQIELANQIGSDPWFCLPLGADEAYVRSFATYVRDNLDPGLRATFETANEVWNFGFPEALETQNMAYEAGWGFTNDFKARLAMYSKIATNNALVIDEVFGTEAEERAYNVIGGQTANPNVAKQVLTPEVWAANEPADYVDPTTVFDALAVTSYFGNKTFSNGTYRAALLKAITDEDVDADIYLASKLMAPNYIGSIPQVMGNIARNKEYTEAAGIDLVLYEGGQHLDHQWNIPEINDTLRDFMQEFVDSPYLVKLYQELWNGWKELGDGPFMQFTALQPKAKFGSFGLRSNLLDDNERALLLEELNATTENWFSDRSGEHFQQGVMLQGSEDGDLLEGTGQEDFLLGGGGNDTLSGGAEDDGLHGGDGDDILNGGTGSDVLVGGSGTDRAIYEGKFSGYVIDQSDTLLVSLADGSETDSLTGIEFIEFADGTYDVGTGYFESVLHTEIIGSAGNDVLSNYEGGQLVNGGGGTDVFQLGSATGAGVRIQSISPWSQTGRDLKAQEGKSAVANAVYVAARTDLPYVDADLQETGISFHAMSQTLGLEVALLNADVIFNVETVVGSDWADKLIGNNRAEGLDGGGGNDLVQGKNGNDTLSGGAGADRVDAGGGKDTIIYRGGFDRINGGSGTDTLVMDDLAWSDVLIEDGGGTVLISNSNGVRIAEVDNVERFEFTDSIRDLGPELYSDWLVA